MMTKHLNLTQLEALIRESVMDAMTNMVKSSGIDNPGDRYDVNWEEFQQQTQTLLQALQQYYSFLDDTEDEVEGDDENPSLNFTSRAELKHMWQGDSEDWDYEEKNDFIQQIKEVKNNISTVIYNLQEMTEYNPFIN